MTTILQHLRTNLGRGTPPRFMVRGKLGNGRGAHIVIGLDNGNDALKIAALSTEGILHTLRVPAAYAPAQEIRAGEGETTYRVNEGIPFWMGQTAIEHGGDGLPVGSTPQRIVDPRLQEMIAAAIADLLAKAGYAAGTYQVALGFAIPNGEIVRVNDDARTETMGVDPRTRAALEAHLKGKSWTIERVNPEGVSELWNIRVGMVIPQAQSTGALVAYTRVPEGSVATDLVSMKIVDIGGGDVQATDLSFEPRYQMINTRLCDGTIRIARALRQRLLKHNLSLIAAQEALITRRLLIAGRRQDITPEVEKLLGSQGQAIVAEILPIILQTQSFVLVTGGGAILLRDLLMERLNAEGKVCGVDYDIIDPPLASVINGIGILFASILLASRAMK